MAPSVEGAESASVDADFLAQWPFETDFGDHFESPLEAYLDLKPLLKRLEKEKGRPLRIYDPYYCEGTTVGHLNSCGFEKVINRKRDFYADIANGDLPKHDVIVTNPPYSADHKEKLLDFLLSQSKPFFLLLPSWTAKKRYWTEFVSKFGASNCAYLCPGSKYHFRHPEGAQQCTAPFFGIWFCGMPISGSAVLPKWTRMAARNQKRRGLEGIMLPSVAALEGAGLVRSAEAEKDRQLSNDNQRKRREIAMKALKAQRDAAQGPSKKRHRGPDTRALVKFDGPAPDFKKHPRACRHFFSDKGCTRGDVCRFAHSVEEEGDGGRAVKKPKSD